VNEWVENEGEMKKRRIMLVAIVISVVLVACSDGDKSSVTVDDAWGRTSPAVAANAAFYMVIEGGSDADTLVSADTAACGLTELHVSVMNDGVMSMQHLPDGIDVPAGETVMLEPGSFHVMCIDRQQEFVAGASIPLTLEFAGAGTIDVNVEIRDE
jgi:copper(I)-binding protein